MRHPGLFLVALAVLSYNSLLAQEAGAIEGRVRTKEGQGIEGAVISVRQTDNTKIIVYTVSRSNGDFSLCIPAGEGPLSIEVRHMGYKTVTLDLSGNLPVLADIQLEEEVTQLKTIHIKPVAIEQRGDTLRYDITTLTTIDDKTIGDVLKKLPGVEVLESGAIKYQGIPINRFYVENMDLMGGRYGMITQNMAAGYFSTIEILERHQPVKVLRQDIRPANAALNLKLKQKYKSRWLGTFDLSLGAAPLLWSESAFLTRFAISSQSLFLAKADNTGKNLFEELRSFDQQGLLSGSYRYAAVESQDPMERMYFDVSRRQVFPLLDNSASLLNTSYMVAANHLSKLTKDLQSRLNISCIYTRDTSRSVRTTRYFIPGQDTVTVRENTTTQNKRQVYQLEYLLTANTDNYFLENKIYGKLNFSEINSLVDVGINTTQQFRLPYTLAGNHFNFIKKIGKSTLKIASETFYNSSQQSLDIEKDLEKTRQTIHYKIVETTNEISLKRQLRHTQISSEIGIDYSFQSSDSQMENPFFNTDSTFCFTAYSFLNCYVGESLNFKFENLDLSFSLPIGWSFQSYLKSARWYFNPRLNMVWEPSVMWRIMANGNLSTTPEYSIEEMGGGGYMMRDYRTFFRTHNGIYSKLTASAMAGINYKNVSSLFFASLMTQYSYNGNYLYPGQNVLPDYTIRYRHEGNNTLQLFLHSITMDKSFFAFPLKLKLNATATEIRGDIMQFGELSPYDNWSFNGSFCTIYSLGNNAVLKYTYDMTASRSYIHYANTLNITFLIAKKLKINTDIKWLNNQISPIKRSNLFFADLNLSYDFKHVHLYIAWNNIFNKRAHEISYFSELSDIALSYTIRPLHVLLGMSFSL